MSAWYERLRRAGARDRAAASLSYRHMARLIERDFASSGACLAFSSPDGDRVTTNALLLLAHSLRGEIGGDVLVVDTRLHEGAGGLSSRLGLAAAPGFADALRDGLECGAEYVHPTQVPGVHVMPAGRPKTNGGLPLDRARLRDLLEDLRRKHTRVLLHVGSVLDDTRNLLISLEADAVFLVIVENRTLMASLEECRRILERNGAQDVRVLVSSDSA